MDGSYDVTRNGQAVGTATLSREGLYYRVSCRCRLSDGEIHRLYADGERLGVLIPENGELTLKTKVAAKRLKEGCSFAIGENRGKFIPIRPGEAFGYLDKLRTGHLGWRDGCAGLVVE